LPESFVIVSKELLMQVVVVEPDGERAESVSSLLRDSGYATDVARDEKEMQQLIRERSPAAIILAPGASAGDHLRIIREFRSRDTSTPLVLITPLGKDDGIRGLDAGADDYLTRPASRKELLARLRALFRRCGCEGPDVLRVDTLEIDRQKRTVTRNKQRIDLTNREFALLEALMLASPEPVSRSALLERIWQGQLSQQTNVVNVIINRLRNKITLPGTASLLHTIWGVGYALRAKNS
jgi:DNA-binding response OmpR family regulator